MENLGGMLRRNWEKNSWNSKSTESKQNRKVWCSYLTKHYKYLDLLSEAEYEKSMHKIVCVGMLYAILQDFYKKNPKKSFNKLFKRKIESLKNLEN